MVRGCLLDSGDPGRERGITITAKNFAVTYQGTRINMIDTPGARPHEVLDEVFELFVELGASDEQLDFRGVYASGRDGTVIEFAAQAQTARPAAATSQGSP